jgi:hypothetical protein
MNNLVDAFIQLQSKANKQIEAYGQTTEEVVFELERVSDMLTPDQVDELISRMSEIEH